ncbi:disulfide bond formation protein B [Propionivibrio dicarboxylicus]|uniref:Disulfide bond formation protein DsbB n=1 Tax=Propionivibrio dicarboxylicus TaxID=83767 RepID=A0A1G8EZ64_9RHOO|nr:disulfide bond formation protein B [Propionivibrio dicarboxylicus]SDH75142.1 disulfide bond formation protein DsbB [Propionivibrio dicarboxylicus]
MKNIATLIHENGRQITLVMALFALGLGLFAVTLANLLRLDACHLCIFQRLAFFVIGALLIFAFFGWENLILRRVLLGIASACCGWCMNVAAQQSWLQWFPESGLTCTIVEPGVTERLIDWLGQIYPLFFMATGSCESKDLVVFGLSLANWSFLVLLIFLAANMCLLAKGKKAL